MCRRSSSDERGSDSGRDADKHGAGLLKLKTVSCELVPHFPRSVQGVRADVVLSCGDDLRTLGILQSELVVEGGWGDALVQHVAHLVAVDDPEVLVEHHHAVAVEFVDESLVVGVGLGCDQQKRGTQQGEYEFHGQ